MTRGALLLTLNLAPSPSPSSNPNPNPNPNQRWEADAWSDRGGGGAPSPEALAGPLQPDHRDRLQGLAQNKGEAQRRQDAQICTSSLLDP